MTNLPRFLALFCFLGLFRCRAVIILLRLEGSPNRSKAFSLRKTDSRQHAAIIMGMEKTGGAFVYDNCTSYIMAGVGRRNFSNSELLSPN